MVRTVFKYGYESGLLDRPVRYGPTFRKPSASVLRRHRAMQGPNLFTASEILRLLDAATPALKAMMLLGINCGFGNSDCGNLPLRAVDLNAGIIDYPRPKTGIARRCPLWPETVSAIRASLEKRSPPKNEKDAGLVFVTKYGESWWKETRDNPIAKETRKLLIKLGINGRTGLGYYTLRHTFRTIADEAKDQPAVDFIMGHVDASMAGHYRERIDDNRLRAIADHVRAWLFAEAPDGGTTDVADGTTTENSGSCEPSEVDHQNQGDARPMLRLFAG
jgi:integrase